MKKTKLLVLILSLALLVSGIVGISVSAEDADPTVAIEGKNISYMEVSTLVVAVSYENADLADVKLNVWYGEKSGDATVLTTTETIDVDGKTSAMFVLDGTPAKNVADRVYYEAFIEGTEVKTALESYSVLEYALEGVVNSTDAAEAARYQSIIDYATSIQEWLAADGKFEGTLAKDYSYVQIEGGTLDENGTTKGVYANGTTITPVGDGVSNWSMDVNGAITVMAAGESFTVSGNAKIEPSDYFETFESGTLPSTIESVSTHPTIPSLGNSYTAKAPTIGTVDNNATNALLLQGSYQSTKTFAKVSETTAAENGANKVVFETDIAFNWNTSGSDKEFFNIVLTDASGNIAFNLVGRNYQTGTNIQAVLRDSTGTSKTTFTLISEANGYSWHKLRIEYSYDETNGLAISIYVDNALKTTWTTAYTDGTFIDDTDIANVYLLLNARTDASHVINSTVALDNLKFEHVVAD